MRSIAAVKERNFMRKRCFNALDGAERSKKILKVYNKTAN